MDLASLRTTFRSRSGRMDLADAEVDYYLNAGQRWLDAQVSHPKATARAFKQVKAGAVGVTFSATCRVIERVEVANRESRTKLEKREVDELRAAYPGMFSSLGQGRPLYWMPALLRTNPDVLSVADLQVYMGYLDALVGVDYGYNGVILYPPADGEYVVEVTGKFFSPQLGGDNSGSWWAEVQPHLLLMAARRALEVDYRNREGVQDWEAAMASELSAIEGDMAEQESIGVRRMLG